MCLDVDMDKKTWGIRRRVDPESHHHTPQQMLFKLFSTLVLLSTASESQPWPPEEHLPLWSVTLLSGIAPTQLLRR